ncbi:hypothetical protein L6452_27631 [Arctium lappa]|uniref:Uncharacterized protein n=1 Tax=Arctium lappa TaxID=4217 RepID=A0ACB8ZWG3_ARCLA|nr:hypothetical protein L6452_27631 [Arctium lappa]
MVEFMILCNLYYILLLLLSSSIKPHVQFHHSNSSYSAVGMEIGMGRLHHFSEKIEVMRPRPAEECRTTIVGTRGLNV